MPTLKAGGLIAVQAMGLVLVLGLLDWLGDIFYGWGVWPVGAAFRLMEFATLIGGSIYLIGLVFGVLKGWHRRSAE